LWVKYTISVGVELTEDLMDRRSLTGVKGCAVFGLETFVIDLFAVIAVVVCEGLELGLGEKKAKGFEGAFKIE